MAKFANPHSGESVFFKSSGAVPKAVRKASRDAKQPKSLFQLEREQYERDHGIEKVPVTAIGGRKKAESGPVKTFTQEELDEFVKSRGL